jgi:hypothetical protein
MGTGWTSPLRRSRLRWRLAAFGLSNLLACSLPLSMVQAAPIALTSVTRSRGDAIDSLQDRLGSKRPAHAKEPVGRGQDLASVLSDVATGLRHHVGEAPARSTAGFGDGQIALSHANVVDLAQRCAAGTPGSVVAAIVQQESAGHPLAISTNGAHRQHYRPRSQDEAVALLARLEVLGANYDVGLMQLNSANLHRLHVAAAEALEPCRNVQIGSRLFDIGYARAIASARATVPLLSAYSIYNTGDARNGYTNGYANAVDARLRSQR